MAAIVAAAVLVATQGGGQRSAYDGFSSDFIQLPAGIGHLVINGKDLRAVTATVCGDRYRLTGFALPPNGAVQVVAVDASPGASTFFPLPVPAVSVGPPGAAAQHAGIWLNWNLAGTPSASGTIASGTVSGNRWFIRLMFGSGGDCYEFAGKDPLGSAQTGACGPIGTPGGAATVTALPLGLPDGTRATGYAVELSPDTVSLEATFSDGSSHLAYPKIVAGRKYAAFTVADSIRLTRLTWIGANGKVLASTAAVPRYGYVQVLP